MPVHKIEAGLDEDTGIRTLVDSYVVSSRGTWVPGSYESERAAKYALRFPDSVLLRLQDVANKRPAQNITYAELQEAAKELKK